MTRGTHEAKQLWNRASMVLMEAQNALTEVAINGGVTDADVPKLEVIVRELRTLTDAMWATAEATESTGPTNSPYDDKEVQASISVGSGYIEFEFGYPMISKSTLFSVFIRRLPVMKSLINANRAWHFLMSRLLDSAGPHIPFDLPISKAEITMTVLHPTEHLRDPDHVWFRPLLDALTRNRVLKDDDFSRVSLKFEYGCDRKRPALIMQVWPEGRNKYPVRSSNLVPVLVI